MLFSDLHVGYVLGMGVVWGMGTAYLVSRALLHVQRQIALEVKDYLGQVLLEHRDESTKMVTGNVSEQLSLTKEELRVALSDVIAAEKAQVLAEDAKGIAEKSNQAKTEFMSRMSHEIRTPINGIVGSLGLIDTNSLNSQVAEDVERAILSSNRLLVIVNELLDFSKSESSEVQYQQEPFDLFNLCHDVVDRMSPLSSDKGLGLHLAIKEGTVSYREGDEQRINQVLINLISNAIKFTDNGQINIHIDGTDDEGLVKFEVVDTGIGIEESKKDFIFEEFTQIDSGNNRKNGGTGLGLSICKKFVEGMGGTIVVESKVGVGSFFGFNLNLPVVKDNLNDDIVALVVDDDEINRQVAKRYLEKMDIGVDLAASGDEAIEKTNETKYDIIFMDLQMPNMDGFETTRRIRANENGYKVRIVSLTASLVGEVQEGCIEAGMDGYISKPFSVSDIEREINQIK